MFCRVSAAVAAAAIAAMLLVPAQSNATGGAGMAGHRGGFRPLVHRPDPLFVHRKFRERHGFEHRRHRRNVDGFAGYGYGGDGYGGGGYGDNGYAGNGYADNGYGDYRFCKYGYDFGYPFTCRTFSAFYGRYYDPSDIPGSIWVPPYTVRPAPVVSIAGRVDPPINRGGCRSETVPMPSSGGAERSVIITRC